MDHILNCSGYAAAGIEIVRGEASTLYDARGKGYVDFEAGVWCAALGHGHPRVVTALQAQAGRLAHLAYRYDSPVIEEAAVALLESLTLADGRCVFLSSGSEAVEVGVQAARELSGRPLLLTLSDAYLAAYGSAARRDPSEWYAFDWSGCAHCERREACDPECERLGDVPFGALGGFAFEPGNSGGLVRLPPRGLVRTLAERIQEGGGYVVVDEVTTGLGRTGSWFGYQHYDLQPDIVALGKGLGNGYPVSAVALTRQVAERLNACDFHHAQSHQNDPLGCAVAREVLTVLREEGLIERSAQLGARFLGALDALVARHAPLREARGRGLMIALEFAEDARPSVTSTYHALLGRGFIVGCKPAARILRFYPPLIVGEEEIEGLVEALDAILEGTKKSRRAAYL
ncbi:MAG: aspartate aminotransferase family protein [Anaerolineales bacterium]